MSELLKDEIKQNLGKVCLIFLHNEFRYKVKLLDCDGVFLKALDLKNLTVRFFRLEELQSLELEEIKDES